jgi:hypothetical protein
MHCLKHAFRATGCEPTTLIDFATSCGCVLAFEALPTTAMAALERAWAMVVGYSSSHADYQFKFSAAVSEGTLFRYSGVTDNLVLYGPEVHETAALAARIEVGHVQVAPALAPKLGELPPSGLYRFGRL